MPKTVLNLKTLGELDGGAVEAMIDRELQRAVNDLDDRGEEDEKPRKVVIEVELRHKDKLVTISAKAQAKLPPMQSGNTVADVRLQSNNKGAALVFQTLNPERPDQSTIYDEDQQ